MTLSDEKSGRSERSFLAAVSRAGRSRRNMHCIILAHATKLTEGQLLPGRGAVARQQP
jgi:hypothetical protein